MRHEPSRAGGHSPITLRIAEACRATGIGRSKLYELINVGEIETVKIGRITLIPVTSIEQLVARCRNIAAREGAAVPQMIAMHPFVANAVITGALSAMPDQLRSALRSIDELKRSRAEDDLAARIVKSLKEADREAVCP